MKLLLDANAYSDLEAGDRRISHLLEDADTLPFSMVVVGELIAGFRNGNRFEKNLSKLERFLSLPRVTQLGVTWDTADRYSRIITALRRKGRPIPTNDIWIAAHAMETGAYLVSSDSHFKEIDGLAWINPSGEAV